MTVGKITLKSSDEKEFSIDRVVADQSVLLKNMLEDLEEGIESAIPLPNVLGKVLEKVLEYCQKHISTEELGEWDSEYIDVDEDFLFEIILAANYLDIKPLLDLGCKTVANMLKGKTPDQIREMFHMENDFTPEEEELVRKELEWATEC